MPSFEINQTLIGDNQPCYVIAELSANHNQSLEIAIQSIKAIKKSGANAVKVQSYNPDSIALNTDQPWFKTRQDSLWAGQRMYDVYKVGQTPWEWHEKLQMLANEEGLDFFSSPFDLDYVDKLESLNVPAYKVASLEITDIPLIRKIARTGKPVIISTGAAEKEDIDLAIQTCLNENNDKLALLKCTSAYPTPYNEVNLRMISELQDKFSVITGLSDHTLGVVVPVAAVTLGAKIVEKHFILDKHLDALDKEFSLDPMEFKYLVDSIRNTEAALGSSQIRLSERMISAAKFKRSLYAVEDIPKGGVLSTSNVRSLRPGLGLHPKFYDEILSRRASQAIEKGTPLNWNLLEE